MTLTDSKQRVLAPSRLRPSTSHITNDRYVIHLTKSGLMSLRSSQQLQKIMLLLKMTGKNTSKNNTWSQLSAVVSTMGMLRLQLPTGMWFLSILVHMQGQEQEAVSSICIRALPLWQACHLFSYRTFSNSSCSEKTAYYTQDKDNNQPNLILTACDEPDDLKVRM